MMRPAINDIAPVFSLKTLENEEISLSQLIEKGNTLILLLRGWPNYQCPLCTRQVGEFINYSHAFNERKTNVLLIYPGPLEGLGDHASEFLKQTELPENFIFAIDPDYLFVDAYGLRWDAQDETAYPATFVVDQDRKIRFLKISDDHAGRSSASEIVDCLDSL